MSKNEVGGMGAGHSGTLDAGEAVGLSAADRGGLRRLLGVGGGRRVEWLVLRGLPAAALLVYGLLQLMGGAA